jgi:dephospho-CoA kinase
MLKIGITGGIGSGKSTVCDIFSQLGIPVYNSDIRAKELMSEDAELREDVIRHFGEKAYENGELNRPYLADVVFNNKEKLEILNSLVHPAVGRDFNRWLENHRDSPYILKEAALLLESGSYKTLDKMIMVNAPEELRISRVMERDSVPREEVEKRISNQWSEEKKSEMSDYFISNNGEQLLVPQVMKLHEEILNLSN